MLSTYLISSSYKKKVNQIPMSWSPGPMVLARMWESAQGESGGSTFILKHNGFPLSGRFDQNASL